MNQEDRIFWSGLEWWKAVYDFYKHLQTITLASLAVVGALLGGPFEGTLSPDGALGPKLFAVAALSAFLVASLITIPGMSMGRRNILYMRAVTNVEELQERRDREKRSKTIWAAVRLFYIGGVFAFVAFLISSLFPTVISNLFGS